MKIANFILHYLFVLYVYNTVSTVIRVACGDTVSVGDLCLSAYGIVVVGNGVAVFMLHHQRLVLVVVGDLGWNIGEGVKGEEEN